MLCLLTTIIREMMLFFMTPIIHSFHTWSSLSLYEIWFCRNLDEMFRLKQKHITHSYTPVNLKNLTNIVLNESFFFLCIIEVIFIMKTKQFQNERFWMTIEKSWIELKNCFVPEKMSSCVLKNAVPNTTHSDIWNQTYKLSLLQ